MDFPWYEPVPSDSPIDQGDLIFDCPVAGWRDAPVDNDEGEDELRRLRGLIEIARTDVVVMSQTCDLHQRKIRYVILCPHYPLSEYGPFWQAFQAGRGQKTTPKSWGKHSRCNCVWTALESVDAECREGRRLQYGHTNSGLPRSLQSPQGLP